MYKLNVWCIFSVNKQLKTLVFIRIDNLYQNKYIAYTIII